MPNITTADVLSPLGWIEASHFPAWKGTKLADNITAWIAQAYADARVTALATEAERNAVAKIWVNYRAADQIAVNLNRQAATAQNTAQGGKTHIEKQMKFWEDRAAGYLEQFESGVTPDEDELEPESISPTYSLETEREY